MKESVRRTPGFHATQFENHCSNIKADVARFPLRLVPIYKTAQCHVTEDSKHQGHRHETSNIVRIE